MREIFNKIVRKIRFIYSYGKSYLLGILTKRDYKNINVFVIFVGYPRSGHSLIASILDAHPNIVISMEWNVLSYIKMGFNKNQIFSSIINNSKKFAIKKHNIWSGYSYKVENMWQGKFLKIKAIGDKLGGRTSLMIKDEPELIEILKSRIDKPIKFIHVIRNPFDTITTMAIRTYEMKKYPMDLANIDLLPFINGYFDRANTIIRLKQYDRIDVFDIYHEDFILNSRQSLKELLHFIGVKPSEEYYTQCSKIVFQNPHKSRFDVSWSEKVITIVENSIPNYPFLKRYSYNS